eukprot:CAMPEP_0201551024 /NCGR_PEP_ID=MMETSP0173_2-20130828/7273_1 /ASSEMBLY_ACC=CAM_ASM_000268 /TAXON_ID=218659 /ORGANISM="Vexillifera sp., Strain DIVA3 564/2" /LENGTH=63 /DNA_ID=CAMNT_0047961169 /DNA_START=440 /DNA_END=631 /DNA_ORIENTATION=-
MISPIDEKVEHHVDVDFVNNDKVKVYWMNFDVQQYQQDHGLTHQSHAKNERHHLAVKIQTIVQ